MSHPPHISLNVTAHPVLNHLDHNFLDDVEKGFLQDFLSNMAHSTEILLQPGTKKKAFFSNEEALCDIDIKQDALCRTSVQC